MSESAIFLDPFTEIIDFHLGWNWRFRLSRDDGAVYTPQGPDRLTLRLDAEEGTWLFTGQTALAGGPSLPYEAAADDLVAAFTYQEGVYTVSLRPVAVRHFLQRTVETLRCRLVTAGEQTLQTLYPRGYLEGAAGLLLPPGVWEVTVPLWSVTTVESFPDLMTTDRKTTVRASIPHQVTYTIHEGDTLGQFLLPVVGVVWRPNADLSGWVGSVQVENVCDQGATLLPWQASNLEPPATPPTQPGDRLFLLHQNVPLWVGLGPCPQRWAGMAIAVVTDFGYQGTIPFAGHPSAALQVDHPLGEQAVTLSGKDFFRRYRLLWEPRTFTYDTGEGALRILGQTATLLHSPFPYFDRLQVQPLPEQGP